MSVKEQAVKVSLSRFKCGRLARAQLFINLEKRLFGILSGVFFYCGFDSFVVSEEFADFIIRAEAERAQEGGDKDFSVFIDSYIEEIVCVCFVFEPCASVRDNRVCEKLFTGFIMIHMIINAG